MFHDDYHNLSNGPKTSRDYFPVDDNRFLVDTLRDMTDAPIMAGGFGFSTHANLLFKHLELDYGVVGDPDDVFEHFDDIVAGRDLSAPRGLIYRGDKGQLQNNPRGFYEPLDDIEYTDPIFDQMVRFYGHAQVFGANPPTVAVEVMRGCPFKCFFCTEPHVKGRAIRYRNLDVVEAELEGLVRRHIRRFWLICSELDIQGVKFAMELAERIIRLRERYGVAIDWSAYALPRLKEDDLRVLERAGYVGALNDVLSLDDDNLRKAGVPYRSKQAVAFLKAVTTLDREQAAHAANASSAEAKVSAGLTQRTPMELASVLGLFLGNAHATPVTIAKTLRRIEDEGLRENYRMALAFPATRVFEIEGQPICETTTRALRTYGPGGSERDIDLLHPTFYYPEFLLDALGSTDAIITFLRYVAETFMSVNHRARKNWSWFLAHHMSAQGVRELLEGTPPLAGEHPISSRPSDDEMRMLLTPPEPARGVWGATAKAVVDHVIAGYPQARARVREALGLPDAELSEYRLSEALYEVGDTREAIVAAVSPASLAERFYLEWLLYANNVILRPEYRDLLFERPSAD